jgi:hypothetical protein
VGTANEKSDFPFSGGYVMKLANPRFILAVCALTTVFSFPAQAAYTAANVKGSYSFLLDKWTATAGGNGGVLGILTFNGVNSVTGSFTEVTTTGLQTIDIETGSTYTVEPSGSGSMSLVTTGGTITLDFVLTAVLGGVAQGLQLLEKNASEGNYVTAGDAVAIKLSGSATAANLKGSYSFLTNYWTAEPTASQTGLLGTATFDGVSKVTLSYTREVDGVAATRALSGTYSVSPDGSGSMVFTIHGADFRAVDFVLNSFVESIAGSFQFLITASTVDQVGTGTAVFQ